MAELSTPPEQGQLVSVRERRFIVTDVARSTLPDSPLRPSGNGAQHLVSLSSIEDDALGEELQVFWEIEPGAKVIEKVALPDPTGFDDWEVLLGQGSYYNPELKGPIGRRRITGYTTEVITDLALDWLEHRRDDEQPFLLMVHHKAPHRRWLPGPRQLSLYEDVDFPEPAPPKMARRGPSVSSSSIFNTSGSPAHSSP